MAILFDPLLDVKQTLKYFSPSTGASSGDNSGVSVKRRKSKLTSFLQGKFQKRKTDSEGVEESSGLPPTLYLTARGSGDGGSTYGVTGAIIICAKCIGVTIVRRYCGSTFIDIITAITGEINLPSSGGIF